ncbi:hypothetical protein E2C01_061328 [Portunus trituberculatus]|uniref:Uncharacterized protein n=1 Tax=Portunus trituberculatus TaxID=210409 RepID=A0A5B7H7T9_PORTR|nr:hypothetical protein [Portunus trituberculatus]
MREKGSTRSPSQRQPGLRDAAYTQMADTWPLHKSLPPRLHATALPRTPPFLLPPTPTRTRHFHLRTQRNTPISSRHLLSSFTLDLLFLDTI